MSLFGDRRDVETLRRTVDEPDIMNDPAYNSRTKGKEKDGDDVDTCRICRGEGSHEEPLFYPCKCSGSIKFVHQNCLMEWLAHSQKKHCELCKTSFRFTKLYHPQMPSTVPIPVFLRQAALHGWSSFQTWTRFQMVFFVWVLWLPWCMRTIWRGLFWIGDGAWVDWSTVEEQMILRHYTNLSAPSKNAPNASTSQSLDPREALLSTFIDYFGSKATQMINSNPWRKEPISLSLAKRIYRLISRTYSGQDIALTGITNSTHVVEVMPRSSTWLSEVTFFSTMTRSTTFNNVIIDILEGQLITLLVVVAFILIFLIREWVMQQQQNMLLGPDGENDGARGPNIDAPVQPQPDNQAIEQNPALAGPEDNPRPRLFLRQRRRINRPLPQGLGEGEEGERWPTGGNVAPQEPAGLSTHGTSNSPLANSHKVLPPKISENGDSVNPPIELENLLRESAVFREVLQRVRDDPSLDILTTLQNEIPTFEFDNLLQRLRAPEVAPYVESKQFASRSPELETFDDKVGQGNHGESNETRSTGYGKDFEFHTGSGSEYGIESTSKISAEARLSTVDDTDRNSGTFRPIHPPQAHGHAISPIDGLTVDSISDLDSNVEGITQPRHPLHRKPSWTFDDLIVEQNNGSQMKKDPSITSSLPKSAEDDIEGMGSSEILERLEIEKMASGVESADIGKATLDPTIENAHDERLHTPDNDGVQDQSYFEAVKNWLWGGITLPPRQAEQVVGDEEHIVGNLAEEEPFVPIAHGQHVLRPPDQRDNQAQDPEVLAAAAQAGVDPNEAEAVDDMEDLEGIMELIGMEGPLGGLVQNGMFCAVLVSFTIFFGVWIPYMFGKLFLTFLASPISLPLQLIRLASTIADMVVDTFVLSAGGLFYWIDALVNTLSQPLVWISPAIEPYINNKTLAQTSAGYAERALDRLTKMSLTLGEGLPQVIDLPTFSIVAHESLWQIKSLFGTILKTVSNASALLIGSLLECKSLMQGLRLISLAVIIQTKAVVSYTIDRFLVLANAAPSILQLNPLRLTLGSYPRMEPLNLELASWDSTDRMIAIAAGYTLFAFSGMLYLYVAGTLHGKNKRGAVNGNLAQVLYQAGGVLKVILIISIEMIVFPLYCGLLLDVALLPLFSNVTLMSRVAFSTTSPWTSMFVHWFVGTCYMFHFALFVSMCRKIMRTGVLCMYSSPH